MRHLILTLAVSSLPFAWSGKAVACETCTAAFAQSTVTRQRVFEEIVPPTSLHVYSLLTVPQPFVVTSQPVMRIVQASRCIVRERRRNLVARIVARRNRTVTRQRIVTRVR